MHNNRIEKLLCRDDGKNKSEALEFPDVMYSARIYVVQGNENTECFAFVILMCPYSVLIDQS